MPINHFENRPEASRHPSQLTIGDVVQIIQKEDQGTRDRARLVTGRILHIYSHGDRYENGAKVQIMLDQSDPRYESMGMALFVGRVQYIISRIDDEENPYMKYVK